MSESYVPSRLYSLSYAEDGSLILHHSRTGAIGMIPAEDAASTKMALQRTARHEGPLEGVLADLLSGGFLVPEGSDERELVQHVYLQKYEDNYLHLVILPTEDCNFRCVYCYESFERGEMSSEIREGVMKYISSQSQLRDLKIEWFGGEPLFAPDTVIGLSRWFNEYCNNQGINYDAAMTTNGSLLTPEIADTIIPLGVRQFQITIDGICEEHNKKRMRADGTETFEDIMRNLRYLKSTEHTFLISLRHNFDPKGLESLDAFIALLKNEFGGDPRFTIDFHPIGKWGGANDSDLEICEARSAIDELMRARQLIVEAGFRGTFGLLEYQPNSLTCYASSPRSFVIGSDGRVYKCTIELDYHDRNVVGQLHPDGSMKLDWRKMALWVETNGHSYQPATKCSSCFFTPVCHGAACPKQWMDEGTCDCPPVKVAIRKSLPLILKESLLPPLPDLAVVH